MWDNYTGPYWSNGQIQSSVPFGDADPIDEVGIQSRLHDTAYHVFQDQPHREAADWIYRHNVGLISGGKARLVGDAPFFFNSLETYEDFLLITPLAIPTLVGHYVERENRASQISSGALQQEIKDVLKLYDSDPLKMRWHNKVVPAAEEYARKRDLELAQNESDSGAGSGSDGVSESGLTPTPTQPTAAPNRLEAVRATLGEDVTEVAYQPGVNGPIDPVLMFNPYWRPRKRGRRNKHASNQE
jgi:hypothetical protein